MLSMIKICILICLGISTIGCTLFNNDAHYDKNHKSAEHQKRLPPLDIDEVAYIVVGDDGYAGHEEYFRISDHDVIAVLAEELNSLANRDDAQASFSGTLPWHYFVSHDGIVLASVMIITNQRPSVFVIDKEVQIHNGQIFLEMPYLPGKGNSGELPMYCKIILNLMRDNIPERISELEEMTGESMEFRLGIR